MASNKYTLKIALFQNIQAGIVTDWQTKVSQKGMIDVEISDHQLTYCTRKIRRIKHNMHNQIQVRSLKKYSTEIFTNA